MRAAVSQPRPRKREAAFPPRRASGAGIRRLLASLACLLLLMLVPARAANHPPNFRLPQGEIDPWLPHGPEGAWNGLASSADGRLLAATARDDRVHTSTDFGLTWTPRGDARAWQAIASSADGNRLVAVVEGGRIHTSSDAGNTWTEREKPRNWSAVASSSDGLWLAATVNSGRIHTSTDAGVTWSEGASVQAWSAIASSADGRKLVAAVYDGAIHASTDAGQTWTVSGPIKLWKALASSADGTRLVAAVWDGRISTSTDSAAHWTEWDSNPLGSGGRIHRWRSLATTADGSVFAAAEEPSPPGWRGWGLLAMVNDSPRVWEEQGRKLNWSAITCSADGLRWAAAGEGDRIHTQFRTTSRLTLPVSVDSGTNAMPGFATAISPGSPEEAAQHVNFLVTTDDPTLFLVPPAIRTDGTLEFTPGGRPGRAIVTVVAKDDGGTAEGGQDVSAAQTFGILVQSRAFVASPWNNDADTGISRSSTLWAYRFAPATNPPAVIDGVQIPPVPGTQPAVPGRFSVVGFDHERHQIGFLTALGGEGSARLAGHVIFGSPQLQFTLEGLVPGVAYTLHVFGLPPDAGSAPVVWSAGPDQTVVAATQFGRGRAIRVSHSFVASKTTYRVGYVVLAEHGWLLAGLALNSVPPLAALEQPTANPVHRDELRDFGARTLGADTNLVFTVRNTGVVPLSGLRFTKSGPNPDDFDVVAAPSAPILGSGGTATFTVEFSPTAVGSRSATLRLESNDPQPFTLRLSGTGLPEDAVLVRDIPDQVIDEDGRTDPLPFTLTEPGPGRSLSVTAKSSDLALVPNANIVIQGTGSRRQVVVTPAPDRSGSTVIRIRASDGLHKTCQLFRLTVNSVNDPPRFGIPSGTPIPVGGEWTPRGPRLDWRAVAMSHDGRRLVAVAHGGRIHTSADGGVTWVPHDEERAWTSVASAADGSRLVASVRGGFVHTSSDGGATWLSKAERRDWIAVASAADGIRLAAAVEGGQLYTSADGGASWTARDRNRAWQSLASSADGKTLVAAVQDGRLHFSTDAGENWTVRGGTRKWRAVAVSAQGTRIAAAEQDGPIQVSADGGATWSPRGEDRFWHALACSADGRFLAATETLGRVAVSSDFGLTWSEGGDVHDGSGLAFSGDGRVLVAPVRSGPIQISVTRVEPYTLTVDAKSGPATVRDFVVGVSPGPDNESGQVVDLVATNDQPSLFLVQPAVDPAGALTFTPAGPAGAAMVTLVAHDAGGTARGGQDTSPPRSFRLEVRGEGFSHGPWLDEAHSGINRSATLWAYRFGNLHTNDIAIQGLPVSNIPGIRPEVRGQFTLAGLGGSRWDVNRISVLMGGPSLAGGFVGGGHPADLFLEGLVPGTRYVLFCFGVGFVDAPGRLRVNLWASGDDGASIDEHAYGAGYGIRVAYSFTADAPRRVVTATPVGPGNTWHFYGLALNAAPAGLIVEHPAGTPLAAAVTFDAGSRAVAGEEPAELTFTLRNSGVVPLRDLHVTCEGPQSEDFRLATPPAPEVPGGGARTTFTVRFAPTAAGPRTATLKITSNDPRPEPFTLRLVGTGLPAGAAQGAGRTQP